MLPVPAVNVLLPYRAFDLLERPIYELRCDVVTFCLLQAVVPDRVVGFIARTLKEGRVRLPSRCAFLPTWKAGDRSPCCLMPLLTLSFVPSSSLRFPSSIPIPALHLPFTLQRFGSIRLGGDGAGGVARMGGFSRFCTYLPVLFYRVAFPCGGWCAHHRRAPGARAFLHLRYARWCLPTTYPFILPVVRTLW
jgi:hypothetical protein